jgi:hypothetical protein
MELCRKNLSNVSNEKFRAILSRSFYGVGKAPGRRHAGTSITLAKASRTGFDQFLWFGTGFSMVISVLWKL